jgi:tetratricopeptide (TPR) repeat protein
MWCPRRFAVVGVDLEEFAAFTADTSLVKTWQSRGARPGAGSSGGRGVQVGTDPALRQRERHPRGQPGARRRPAPGAPATGRATTAPAAAAASDDRADRALELAERDPGAARGLAAEVLAVRRLPAGTRLTARLALGRAAWAARDVTTAVRVLRRTAIDAEQAHLPDVAAQARLTLAAALADSGQGRAAVHALTAAARHLEGAEAARVAGQRAYLLHLQGRLPEALTGYQDALTMFRQLGDTVREGVALLNIAVIHTHQGELGRASRELTTAHLLFEEAGEPLRAVHAAANLGWVLARQGRMPEALGWFERAERPGDTEATVDPHTVKDRAEALLGGRLLPEARAAAVAAEREFERVGMRGPVAESRVLAARASLLLGDLATARASAGEAARAAGTDRPAVRALAEHVRLQADLAARPAGDPPDSALLASTRRVARRLEAAGWLVHAAEARLAAATTALALGRPAVARAEIAALRASVSRGPVQLRLAAWHARALLRLAEGDGAGARTALRAGVRVLDLYRDTLGATELRALATGHGLPLLSLGLGLAVADGDAWAALLWSERGRATASRSVAGRAAGEDGDTPGGSAFAGDLDVLRQAAAEAEAALLMGADPRRAIARQVAAEGAVRRRSLLAASSAPSAHAGLGRGALRAALGTSVLLELVEHEGQLFGVAVPGEGVVGRPRAVLRRLGPAADAAAELAALRFAAARLARRQGSQRALDAAAVAWRAAADRLDALLLAPFGDVLVGCGLVLSPSGALHAVPWAALRACAGRRTTVTPSAGLWLRGAGRAGAPAGGHVALVAGPGLECADGEVEALAEVHPGAVLLQGERATAGGTLALLAGARVAHVAAHGEFRSDNPQLSALRLADGPLTVYDLETLARPPRVVVLSACDTGLAEARSGDEVQGLAAGLLGLGAQAVVAAVAPVADDLAAGLAMDLHRELAAGRAPAAALAAVQLAWSGRSPREAGTAASFVCFGIAGGAADADTTGAPAGDGGAR